MLSVWLQRVMYEGEIPRLISYVQLLVYETL